MKQLAKAYRCYTTNGENRVYLNPKAGRADPDETTIVLTEGCKVVELTDGSRALEYRGNIYTDFALALVNEHEIHTNLYQPGDVADRPTGKLFKLADEISE